MEYQRIESRECHVSAIVESHDCCECDDAVRISGRSFWLLPAKPLEASSFKSFVFHRNNTVLGGTSSVFENLAEDLRKASRKKIRSTVVSDNTCLPPAQQQQGTVWARARPKVRGSPPLCLSNAHGHKHSHIHAGILRAHRVLAEFWHFHHSQVGEVLKMGQGSFGTIYIGYDLLTNEEVIDFAIRPRSPRSPSTSLAHPNYNVIVVTQRCHIIKRALKKRSLSPKGRLTRLWPPCCSQVAVKTEPDYGLKGSMLRHEGEMLVQLQGCPGIPDVHWIGGRELAGVVSYHEPHASSSKLMKEAA
jgi:hypothetical protein